MIAEINVFQFSSKHCQRWSRCNVVRKTVPRLRASSKANDRSPVPRRDERSATWLEVDDQSRSVTARQQRGSTDRTDTEARNAFTDIASLEKNSFASMALSGNLANDSTVAVRTTVVKCWLRFAYVNTACTESDNIKSRKRRCGIHSLNETGGMLWLRAHASWWIHRRLRHSSVVHARR